MVVLEGGSPKSGDLGTWISMDMDSTCHGNPSSSYWDISVWTKVVDWPTDQHCHPQSHIASMSNKKSGYEMKVMRSTNDPCTIVSSTAYLILQNFPQCFSAPQWFCRDWKVSLLFKCCSTAFEETMPLSTSNWQAGSFSSNLTLMLRHHQQMVSYLYPSIYLLGLQLTIIVIID